MLLGKYTVTVGKDGRVFVCSSLSQHYKAGDTYYVLRNENVHETDDVYLTYRFDDEIDPEEKLLKEYTVPANKHLRVPPKYREELSGKCYLIGVGSGIELHKAEIFDRNEHPSFEEIEKMMEEFGLDDSKETESICSKKNL